MPTACLPASQVVRPVPHLIDGRLPVGLLAVGDDPGERVDAGVGQLALHAGTPPSQQAGSSTGITHPCQSSSGSTAHQGRAQAGSIPPSIHVSPNPAPAPLLLLLLPILPACLPACLCPYPKSSAGSLPFHRGSVPSTDVLAACFTCTTHTPTRPPPIHTPHNTAAVTTRGLGGEGGSAACWCQSCLEVSLSVDVGGLDVAVALVLRRREQDHVRRDLLLVQHLHHPVHARPRTT